MHVSPSRPSLVLRALCCLLSTLDSDEYHTGASQLERKLQGCRSIRKLLVLESKRCALVLLELPCLLQPNSTRICITFFLLTWWLATPGARRTHPAPHLLRSKFCFIWYRIRGCVFSEPPLCPFAVVVNHRHKSGVMAFVYLMTLLKLAVRYCRDHVTVGLSLSNGPLVLDPYIS